MENAEAAPSEVLPGHPASIAVARPPAGSRWGAGRHAGLIGVKAPAGCESSVSNDEREPARECADEPFA
jgi:hypothetical protein